MVFIIEFFYTGADNPPGAAFCGRFEKTERTK